MGFHPYVEYLPLGDNESLDRAVELLHACCTGAMQDASPPGKRPPGFRSAPWWNEECRAHTLAIMHATGNEKEYLRSRSCPLFRRIKREYYTSICEAASPANIWSLAKWGMGTRSTPIPPLRDGPGFAATPESWADLFLRTFFPPPPHSADHPNPVIGGQRGTVHQLPHSDDPRTATQTFDHSPLTEEEVRQALASVSPTSAPGPSGITWPMVKHVFESFPQGLTSLLNACLDQGYHPTLWRQACVVML